MSLDLGAPVDLAPAPGSVPGADPRLGTKRCSKCGETKGQENFYLQSLVCKACIYLADRARKDARKNGIISYVVKERKKCSRCKEVREASSFLRNADTADGLSSHCKICAKTIRKDRIDLYHRIGFSEEKTEKKCTKCGEIKK